MVGRVARALLGVFGVLLLAGCASPLAEPDASHDVDPSVVASVNQVAAGTTEYQRSVIEDYQVTNTELLNATLATLECITEEPGLFGDGPYSELGGARLTYSLAYLAGIFPDAGHPEVSPHQAYSVEANCRKEFLTAVETVNDAENVAQWTISELESELWDCLESLGVNRSEYDQIDFSFLYPSSIYGENDEDFDPLVLVCFSEWVPWVTHQGSETYVDTGRTDPVNG